MDLDKRLDTFHLDGPIVYLEYNNIKLWQAIVLGVVWFTLMILLSVGLLWLYAVWFAGQVGFQTSVLVGIGLIVLGLGGGE